MKRSTTLLLFLGVLVLSMVAGCQNASRPQADFQLAKTQSNADQFNKIYPEYSIDDPWDMSY